MKSEEHSLLYNNRHVFLTESHVFKAITNKTLSHLPLHALAYQEENFNLHCLDNDATFCEAKVPAIKMLQPGA